jgi:redox-sensing transcriptional repressor
MSLPLKTIERLSKYRQVLLKYQELHEYYIFSHDLAAMLRINPAHVRRDLMLIGFTGNYRNGYQVVDLISRISQVLPLPKTQVATIIGMGKQGQSLLHMILSNPNCPYDIPATFDIEPKNTNQSFTGIPCYDLTRAPQLLQHHSITLAILTVNDFELQEIVDSILPLGIKGIMNFSSGIIRVPKDIKLIEVSLHTLLDEMAYLLNADLISS